MLTALALALVAFGLFVKFKGPERPTELNPDIWDRDPAKRERNLRLALEAWKTGKIYVRPIDPEEFEARGRLASMASPIRIADPNGDEPERRLVRCCPMHKPHWEDVP